MAALSTYLENQLLTHIFRTSSFTKPSGLYFALASGTLLETMSGNLGGNEFPNANGYARVTVSPADANFSAVGVVAGSGETQNSGAITFPQATGSWGTATYVAIVDSGLYGQGQLLMFAPLQTAKTIGTNDQFSFSAGQLQVYFD